MANAGEGRAPARNTLQGAWLQVEHRDEPARGCFISTFINLFFLCCPGCVLSLYMKHSKYNLKQTEGQKRGTGVGMQGRG